MIRTFALLAVAAGLWFGVAAGRAGPVEGSLGASVEVGHGQPWKATLKFRGGVRACAIAWARQPRGAPVSVEVRDAKDKVIGRDNPREAAGKDDAPGSDIATVIWYPPRDGEYTILVRTYGDKAAETWIAIK